MGTWAFYSHLRSLHGVRFPPHGLFERPDLSNRYLENTTDQPAAKEAMPSFFDCTDFPTPPSSDCDLDKAEFGRVRGHQDGPVVEKKSHETSAVWAPEGIRMVRQIPPPAINPF